MGRVGFFKVVKVCRFGREAGELGECLELLGGPVFTGEAGQSEGFVAGAGDLVEKEAELREGLLGCPCEGYRFDFERRTKWACSSVG